MELRFVVLATPTLTVTGIATPCSTMPVAAIAVRNRSASRIAAFRSQSGAIDHELLASISGHQVAGPHRAGQTGCRLAKHLIAGGMSVTIVDRLE